MDTKKGFLDSWFCTERLLQEPGTFGRQSARDRALESKETERQNAAIWPMGPPAISCAYPILQLSCAAWRQS